MNREASPRRSRSAFHAISRTLGRWRYRYARWLGAGLAGLAAMLATGAVLPATPAIRTVPVATRDIPVGEVIADDDVSARNVPADAVTYPLPDRVVGRRATSSIGAGEPITEHRLSVPKNIPPGHVAVAIPLPASMVSQWLNPGDRALAMIPDLGSAAGTEDYETAQRGLGSRAVEVTVISSSSTKPAAGWTDTPADAPAVLLSVRERDVNDVASAARADSLFLAVRP